MEHITRIARILFQPTGNALLVGVGGSGKQSLSKLASFILGYEIFRIVVTTSYSLNDLKTDLQTLLKKTGVSGMQTVFLLTDSQIVDDRYLVYINDILASGYIPELYAKDEVERDENEMNNKNEVNMGHVKDYRYGKEEYKEDNGVGSLYRKLPEENEV